MSLSDSITEMESGQPPSLEAIPAHQIATIAYMTNRPAYIDLGYRTIDQTPVLHVLVEQNADTVIYKPLENAEPNMPVYVGLKGTDSMYTLVKDIALTQFPNGDLFEEHFATTTTLVDEFMRYDIDSHEVVLCGHSLGGLTAMTVYHRLTQQTPSRMASLGKMYGFQTFLQATADVVQMWNIAHSTSNPLKNHYQQRLVHYIVRSDIASLLLIAPDTTFGQVHVLPDITGDILMSLDTMSYQSYTNEVENHSLDAWNVPVYTPVRELLSVTGPVSIRSNYSIKVPKLDMTHSGQTYHLALYKGHEEASIAVLHHVGVDEYTYTVSRTSNYEYFTDSGEMSFVYIMTPATGGASFRMRLYPTSVTDLSESEQVNVAVAALNGGNFHYIGVPSEETMARVSTLPVAVMHANTKQDADTYKWEITTPIVYTQRRDIPVANHLAYWNTGATSVRVTLSPKYQGNTLRTVKAYLAIQRADGDAYPYIYNFNALDDVFTSGNGNNVELPPSGNHGQSQAPDEFVFNLTWDDSSTSYRLTCTEIIDGVTHTIGGLGDYANADGTDGWNPRVSITNQLQIEPVDLSQYQFRISSMLNGEKWFLSDKGIWHSAVSFTKTGTNSIWCMQPVLEGTAAY